MNKVFRSVFLLCTILMLFGNAWALPTVGDLVKMGTTDGSVPYIMTDTNNTYYNTSDDQTYLSFCLELNNYFYEGWTYEVVSIGDTVYGGGTVVGDDGVLVDAAGGDTLEDDTKWLYAAYMSGVFDTVNDAAQLVQEAIWYLEGETLDSEAWMILDDYKDSFDDTGWTVLAVNLSNRWGTDIQSQLIGEGPSTAPVPEPATMFLLGTGLIGMAGLGRRMKKLHM